MITIAYWVIGLPLGYVLAFVFKMSTSGIWIGLITGLTLASLFLIRRFLKMIRLNGALR
jgi:MATE family multidrug resistance protein